MTIKGSFFSIDIIELTSGREGPHAHPFMRIIRSCETVRIGNLKWKWEVGSKFSGGGRLLTSNFFTWHNWDIHIVMVNDDTKNI